MKICWDNLNIIRLTSAGDFTFKNDLYVEEKSCFCCGEPFLRFKYRDQKYCCISCSKIGKSRSDEVKHKISETRIRKGLSKGHNNPMFGKKVTLSKESKRKISVKLSVMRSGCGNTMYGRCGSLSPTWKGGISHEPYCKDWTKEFKDFIKERDGYRCLNPYCVSNNSDDLIVHHIDYDKKNCALENLITVCRSCNSKANKNRKWHSSWYRAILYKRYKYIYKETE